MIDSFNDVLKARRSTREYTEEGVSKEDMQQQQKLVHQLQAEWVEKN